MNELKHFKKNVTSQYGEDGIIEEIFNRIGIDSQFCIEFGAWDGKHLSNVWNLWNKKNWRALLIEADPEKCKRLADSTAEFENVSVHEAFVVPQGESSVGMIVKKKNLPEIVDLLSIDIDGNDFYIFEELDYVKARVIIVEYNPTIPPHLDMVQEMNEYFGASALALLNLAHKRGYKLAAITDTNLFFVIDSEFAKLKIDELDLAKDFLPNHLTYVYSAYDGTSFVDRVPSYLTNKINTLDEELERMQASLPKVKKILNLSGRIKAKEQKLPKFRADIEKIPVRIFKDNL